jgi:hypothetical protein
MEYQQQHGFVSKGSKMKIKTQCTCGQEFIVETDTESHLRADKKRVYPPDDKSPTVDYFRCPRCGECVYKTVKFAEYGEV